MRDIAIGNFEFKKIIEEQCFYVDKTLFIRDYLKNKSDVTLITRPRRFGKTMILSTLNNFFNIELDNKELFNGLNISKYPDIIEKHLNKHPILHLDFKNFATGNFERFRESLANLISKEYSKYDKKYGAPSLSSGELSMYNNIINKKMSDVDITESLKFLTEILYKKYNKKVIVLIDEYDMPLENAYVGGYYNEVQDIMSICLTCLLKGNEYLEKSLVLGCSKVAQSGIFSKLNNLDVCTLVIDTYNKYFGFTENEVKEALEEFNLSDKFDEVKYWYDGYNIGDLNKVSIYNPWSITNYLRHKTFKPYWVNTGSLKFIKELLKITDYNDVLKPLINGKYIGASYTEQIEYTNNTSLNKDEAISLLFHAGYLKMPEMNLFMIVNKEVYDTFEKTFSSCILDDSRVSKAEKTFFDNLINLKVKEAEDNFKELIEKALYTDKESYYYAILDRCSYVMIDRYIAQREQISSSGRSDFILKNKYNLNDAFVIEVKKTNVDKQELVDKIVIEALKQIEDKKYYVSLENEGYRNIHKVAVVINAGEVYIRFKNNRDYDYSDISEYLIEVE